MESPLGSLLLLMYNVFKWTIYASLLTAIVTSQQCKNEVNEIKELFIEAKYEIKNQVDHK